MISFKSIVSFLFTLVLTSLFLLGCSDKRIEGGPLDIGETEIDANQNAVDPNEFPNLNHGDDFELNEVCPEIKARNYSNAISTALDLGGVLSIGESHGNRNSIEFISQLMKKVVNDEGYFVFLLEAPSESQFLFDDVFENKISVDQALENLPSSIFWSQVSDGRQSCAILRLLIEINASDYREKIQFSTLMIEASDFSAGRLKGHVMGDKALEAIDNLPKDISPTIVLLTGRNYQRFDPRKDLDRQSSTCGTLKSSGSKKITCIATIGKGLPWEETPCKVGEAFDLMTVEALGDDFFTPFDMVLTSNSRCADYTPKLFE